MDDKKGADSIIDIQIRGHVYENTTRENKS